MRLERDTADRIGRAKFAYTTRRVPKEALVEVVTDGGAPRAGDLVLARVGPIGQHKRLERCDGRRATLFSGDEIVVCYGHRYAPDQFEAEVPGDLSPCELVAAGGVAGRMLQRHAKMDEPTSIIPIGLLGIGSGRPANLADFSLPAAPIPIRLPLTVAVLGTSMNAGKTTTAANLVRGLTAAGYRTGAAKVTGTGAGGDRWLLTDAGADPVLDFTDAGLVSTYRLSGAQIEDTLTTLTSHLAAANVDALVLEVADGIYQTETAALVGSARFAEQVDGVVFAAADAVGAAGGVRFLDQEGIAVWALSGVLTSSPLAMREAGEATGLPVLDPEALCDPARVRSTLTAGEALAA